MAEISRSAPPNAPKAVRMPLKKTTFSIFMRFSDFKFSIENLKLPI
jgi:hypothetical protein